MEKSLLEIDRIFKRQQARAAKPAARATASANTKSEDMKYLLSGYDYFDVSVSGWVYAEFLRINIIFTTTNTTTTYY